MRIFLISLFLALLSSCTEETPVLEGDASLLYLAAGYGGFRIVDVSNPAAPLPIGGVQEEFDVANSILVRENLAYLASVNKKIWILDVSNPLFPKEITSYPAPGYIESFDFKKPYLYVAAGHLGLRILDVSNLNFIQEIGYFVPEDADTKSVVVNENYAYLANGDSGLLVLDISNPQVPQPVLSISDIGHSTKVRMQDRNLFLLSNSAIYVFDVSNPAIPRMTVQFYRPNTYDIVQNFHISGNYLYAINGAKLNIVDISDLPNFHVTSDLYILDTPLSIFAKSRYAYLCQDYGRLTILDISDPYKIKTVSKIYVKGCSNLIAE